MMTGLSIGLVLVVAILLALGARRAWRTRQPVVKWLGGIGLGLLAVVGLVVVGVASRGLYTLLRPVTQPAAMVQVAGTPEQLARGEKLAHLCIGCHASAGQLPLDGGPENFIAAFGSLYAPNLTPGGTLKDWTDGEVMRAIREGVNKEGRALLIMPSSQFRHMSDTDAQALVAYLRSQPSSPHITPPNELNLLGALVVGAGVFPTAAQPPITQPIVAPPTGPTLAYGTYLMNVAGCRECHGENLTGGTSEFVPVGPNLLTIVAPWSAPDFVKTMRTGIDPNGKPVDPELMPWPDYAAAFSDDEFTALYTYIKSVPR